MGGTKRKIPIEWIEDTNRRAVAFSKRRNGIYSKAAELCQLSGAQIAILVSPVSSQSHVSFYSFGHSSVDSVVSAFLNNERPREEDTVSNFWWEDESLAQSEDPNELRCAINSISSILHRVEALRAQKQRELVLHGDQTLDNIPSTSGTSLCPEDYHHVQGEEQITADNTNNLQLALQEHQTLDCDSDYLGVDHLNGEGQEQELSLDQSFDFMTEQENQTLDCGKDYFDLDYGNNNNINLNGCNQVALQEDQTLDCDNHYYLGLEGNNGEEQEQTYNNNNDFETNIQGTLMMNLDDMAATMNQNPNPYSAFEQDHGTLVMVHTDSDDAQLVSNISDDDLPNNLNQELDSDQMEDAHRDLDQDNLRFSDYFNDLTRNSSHQELDFDQINSEDYFNDLTPIVAL